MIEMLSIIASCFTLGSVGSYLKQLITGESTPNPATWLIWVVITIINTLTYLSVVQGNILTALVSIALAVGISIIFVTAASKHRFTRLGKIETVSLLLAVIAGIVWQVANNAVIANLMLQIIFLISFYPTIHGLVTNQLVDKPLPWILASIAYTILIITLILDSAKSPWSTFAFPIINLLGNGAVGMIIIYRREMHLLP